MILTPAPTHTWQYGKRGCRYYKAELIPGRTQLGWKPIPLWDVLSRIEIRALEYLGVTIVELEKVKGL